MMFLLKIVTEMTVRQRQSLTRQALICLLYAGDPYGATISTCYLNVDKLA